MRPKFLDAPEDENVWQDILENCTKPSKRDLKQTIENCKICPTEIWMTRDTWNSFFEDIPKEFSKGTTGENEDKNEGVIMLNNFNIVYFQEEDWWAAQCLEVDIAAQGKTFEDAQYNIRVALRTQLLLCKEFNKDFEALPKAPVVENYEKKENITVENLMTEFQVVD